MRFASFCAQLVSELVSGHELDARDVRKRMRSIETQFVARISAPRGGAGGV
jgi:hypothetical protein